MLTINCFQSKRILMSSKDEIDNSPVIGGLEIRRSGAIFIKKSLAVSLSDDDLKKFNITVEFLVHALSRVDWMTEFLQARIVKEQELKKADLRRSLRVIDGGNTKHSK